MRNWYNPRPYLISSIVSVGMTSSRISSLTMSNPQLYAIIVSGERFNFTRDQLESDPDNYFATYFFGGFEEAAQGAQELSLEKEPKLFQLIQAHLRGYDVLPIPETMVPLYMTKETVIKNLFNEAQMYGLDLLAQKIGEYQEEQKQKELLEHSKATGIDTRTRPRLYKLGTWKQDVGWMLTDLAEGGVETYLKRGNRFTYASNLSGLLREPGYALLVAWKENNEHFGLLESLTT